MEEKKGKKGSRSSHRQMRSLRYHQRVERRNAFQFRKYLIIFSAIISLIIAIILYQLQFGSCEFWASYERNFNKLMYGDEYYCHRKINASLIHEKLTEQIIGQDDALKLIKGSLNLASDDGYVQIILHGSIGNGKTLSSQIIANHFNNVKKYIWDIHDFSALYDKTRRRLSKCGFNLIILDDLSIKKSIDFLKDFEQKLRDEEVRRQYKIILIAIFKNELTDDVKQDLQSYVIVDFQPITLDGFLKCIEIHQKLYKINYISTDELEELKQINYNVSGCKLLSKKMITIK